MRVCRGKGGGRGVVTRGRHDEETGVTVQALITTVGISILALEQ